MKTFIRWGLMLTLAVFAAGCGGGGDGSSRVSSLAAADGVFSEEAASESSRYTHGKISAAGDVNGDGFADILIGSPSADPAAGSDAGKTYLVYGSANPSGAFSLAAADAIFIGETASDNSGSSVSSAGDVNGDGFDDILIGAVGAGSYAGKTYLFYGSASLSGEILLASADVIFTGEAASDLSGRSVSSAGDVNGDGFDDILIGAIGAGSYAGKTYLIYGSASLSGPFPLAAADVMFTGEAANDWSGNSVYTAGDVNGDGLSDIVIGAPLADSSTGKTYLIYGSASLSGVVSLSAADAIFTGEAASNYSGDSVSAAGDVNNDGFDDILIGAATADSVSGVNTGKTYLIYGSASLSGAFSLATASVIFTGETADDYSGASVSTAGDVNNDGFDDILIGAGSANSAAGKTYLVYGSSGLASTVSLASADMIYTGEATYDESGDSVSSAGDVNNDGFADILIWATGADSSSGSLVYKGKTYLVLGPR